jgi:hypothetical protein
MGDATNDWIIIRADFTRNCASLTAFGFSMVLILPSAEENSYAKIFRRSDHFADDGNGGDPGLDVEVTGRRSDAIRQDRQDQFSHPAICARECERKAKIPHQAMLVEATFRQNWPNLAYLGHGHPISPSASGNS